MICKECGNEIMPGTLFCTNCGAKADAPMQDADSDKTVVLWEEEPQQPKQDDDKTVVLWDEEPQQPKQDDDRTVVLWDEEPQQSKQDNDRTVVLWDEEPQQSAQNDDVPKTCPNCGSQNAGDALFCVECGALMTETKPQPVATPSILSPVTPPPVMTTPSMEQPTMQQGKKKKEKAPKPPKQTKQPKAEGEATGNKKLPIIIGAAAAAVVVIVGAIFIINGLSSKSTGRDLIYLKDNEIYTAKAGSFKPELITDSFYDDKHNADYINVYSSEYSGVQYTEDGKYVFYPQDKEGYEYDLYYKKAGSKEEGTKLESGISSYQVYSKDKIFYEKGDKLYLANLKDKEKIASDISWYGVSGDQKYFYWNESDNGEYTYYIQDINLKKDKVKIKDVSSMIYMSDDYSEIYYRSEDDVYYLKNLKDKVKIASDVAEAYMIGTEKTSQLYYFKKEEDNFTYLDFVKDDVKEDSEYSEYAEYVKDDLKYYEVDIAEYKLYTYQSGNDTSEEVASFTGQLKKTVSDYRYSSTMVIYSDVNVEEVKEIKLSEIIEDYYYSYSDKSLEEVIQSNILDQATYYLITGDKIVNIAGMEELYQEGNKAYPEYMYVNTVTDEIYVSVYYDLNEKGVTYDLYTIPYTEKEVECRLITNDLYNRLYNTKQGIYYISDVDKDGDGGTLFLNGIEMDQDVYPSSLETAEDVVYYLKDINSDHDEGTLCKNKNGKVTEIAEDVAVEGFSSIKDGNVAYLMDYSFKKSKGDLFVFTGRKSIAVDTDVAAILY